MSTEHWALLLATLLHDVPWKPWVVTGRPGRVLEQRVSRECKEYARIINAQEANDREAQALVAWIACRLAEKGAQDAAETLVRVARKEWSHAIHEADVIAASVDRIVSPPLKPNNQKSVWFVNVFNPSLKMSAEVLSVISSKDKKDVDAKRKLEELVDSFLKRLESIVNIVVKSCRGGSADCILRRLYLTLYTLLEVEWFEVSREKLKIVTPPPADTRVPHHTVFDHLRGVAMSLALRERSVYAIVDIPGIHAFVSKARKTRDFWAGSWLVSALAWGAVKSIVESEGPQVVVLPAIHLNPFYLDMLVSEVPGIEERLPPLAWRMLGKWPSQPVMPATVSLLLDGSRWNCERVKKEAEEGIREAWRNIWEPLRAKLEELRSEVEKGLPDWCNPFNWDKPNIRDETSLALVIARLLCLYTLSSVGSDPVRAARLLQRLFDYLIAAMREVPLGIRVTCVEVDFKSKDYKRFISEVLGKLQSMEVEAKQGRIKTDELLAKIASKAADKKLNAESVLERLLRFTYLRLRLDKEAEKIANVTPGGIHRVYREVVSLWEEARKSGRRAYRYCSVCGSMPAVTRLPRIGDIVKTPWGRLRIVGSRGEVREEGDVPLDYILASTDYMVDEGESLCPYCLLRRLLARNPWVARRYIKSAGRASRTRISSTLDTANEWIREEICGRLSQVLEGEQVVGLNEVCREYSLDRILDVLTTVGKSIAHYRRIAVIHGDGDSMGSGYLRGVLIVDETKWPLAKLREKSLDEVLKNLPLLADIPDVYKNLVKRLNSNDPRLVLDAVPSLIYHRRLQLSALETVDEDSALAFAALVSAVSSVLRDKNVLKNDDWPLTIIPTPSYLRTLSNSLIVSSLVDALIINTLKGVLVYAGGDDVLAVVPPAAPAKTAADIPKLLEKVFKEVGGAAKVPLPPGANSGEESEASIALAAVLYTRMNYWGLLGVEKGFHVYRGLFAPATVAHGRSYGVNITHYRTPLWNALSGAERLMNVKDNISVLLLSEDESKVKAVVRAIRKDFMITGFEGEMAGIVPQTLLTHHDRLAFDGLSTLDILAGLDLVMEVYEKIVNGRYTRSLIYDVLEELNTKLATLLAKRKSWRHLVAFTLSILARNLRERQMLSEREESLAQRLSSVILKSQKMQWSVKAPLLTHVFIVVKHLLAGARR